MYIIHYATSSEKDSQIFPTLPLWNLYCNGRDYANLTTNPIQSIEL